MTDGVGGRTERGPIPSTVGVGPGRTGTSWLYRLFRSQANVAVTVLKEPEFFGPNFDRGWRWYESQFMESGGTKIWAEFSNNYYMDDEALSRIASLDHQPRLIFGIREPLDLAVSLWRFSERRGLVLRSPSEFLDCPLGDIMGSLVKDRRQGGELRQPDRAPVREALRLATRLSFVLQLFGPSRVHLFRFDELQSDPTDAGRKALVFAGLADSEHGAIDTTVVNASRRARLPVLGKTAHWGANVLRRIGMTTVLGRLRESRMLDRVLFRESGTDDDYFRRIECDPNAHGFLRQEAEELAALLEKLQGKGLRLSGERESARRKS